MPEGAMRRIAEVTEAVMRLPAVATLDWFDRASGCLASATDPASAGILLATIERGGKVLHVEASGVASVEDAAEFFAHAQRLGDSARPATWVRSSSGASNEENHPSKRSQLENLDQLRIPGVDFSSDSWAQCIAADGASDALLGALSSAWRARSAGELIVAWASIPGSIPGRGLLGVVAPWRAEGLAHYSGRTVLPNVRITLESIARRAGLAIGVERSKRSSWLSAREQQVLGLLVLGMSVKQIAEAMGRSTHTVHDHVKSLHRKLKAKSRGALIARALGHLEECERLDPADHANAHPAEQEGENLSNADASSENADPIATAMIEPRGIVTKQRRTVG